MRRHWQQLIDAGVAPCGLGCRDTLRFEAGLPLYGDELTDEISPIEAGLGIFVKLDKDEFIGRDATAAIKARLLASRSTDAPFRATATTYSTPTATRSAR